MLVVDRIIGGIAVCVREDETVDIPLSDIQGNVREGDVLRAEGGRYAMDTDETARRTAAIQERWNRIKSKNNS